MVSRFTELLPNCVNILKGSSWGQKKKCCRDLGVSLLVLVPSLELSDHLFVVKKVPQLDLRSM